MYGERPIGMRRLWVLMRGLPPDSPLFFAMHPMDATWTVTNRLLGMVAEILANVHRPPNTPVVRVLPHKRERQTTQQFIRSMGIGKIVYTPDPPATSAPAPAAPDGPRYNGEKRGETPGVLPVGGARPIRDGHEDSTGAFSSDPPFGHGEPVDDGGVAGVENPPSPPPEVQG